MCIRDRARLGALSGLGLIAAGLGLWLGAARPDVLISQNGDAVGVMTSQGRAMSKAKGGSFTAAEWLEKDGDIASQDEAAARPLWQGPVKQRLARINGVELLHLTGKGSAVIATGQCRAGRIIVTDQPVAQDIPGAGGAGAGQDREGPVAAGQPDCLLLDALALRETGAIAIRRAGSGAGPIRTRDLTGDRPWSY